MAIQGTPRWSINSTTTVGTPPRISAPRLAVSEGPFNINVNAICPGAVWTRFQQEGAQAQIKSDSSLAGVDPEQVFLERYEPMMPLTRIQTPEDIGKAAAFLASQDAWNITGQYLNVDGGAVIQLGVSPSENHSRHHRTTLPLWITASAGMAGWQFSHKEGFPLEKQLAAGCDEALRDVGVAHELHQETVHLPGDFGLTLYQVVGLSGVGRQVVQLGHSRLHAEQE